MRPEMEAKSWILAHLGTRHIIDGSSGALTLVDADMDEAFGKSGFKQKCDSKMIIRRSEPQCVSGGQ